MPSPQKELDYFLDKYDPELAAQARECLKILRKRLPFAHQLVYDNYNALAIGFAPSEKASEGIFSLALYPRHINFFFLQGAKLPDPEGLLRGSGSVVRHIRLSSSADLKRSDIGVLMETAMESARVPFDPKVSGKLVIRSVSAKQRPRRPS